MPFLIASPLEFGYDPDTGLLSVVAVASMRQQTVGKFEVPPSQMNLILLLTPETARRLLSDLPKLETLLQRAAKGSTTPDFLQ
jgi:hypothetical protein